MTMPMTGRLGALPDPQLHPEYYEGVNTKRLLAWIIDVIIVAGMTLVVVVGSLFLTLFILPMVWLCLDGAYRTITLARGSATWGQRVMGIELRDAQGGQLDLITAALHTLGYLVSMSLVFPQVISVVLMLSSARGQGLSDMILGTAMIRRPGL